MSHSTPEEIAAEAFGLATGEEHENVARHLGECGSCLEEFARRCGERAAIEEAMVLEPKAARPVWALAAGALFLLGTAVALILGPGGPAAPGGSGIRGVLTQDISVRLPRTEGPPEEAILRGGIGTVVHQGDVLVMTGDIQFLRKDEASVYATGAKLDLKQKRLTLDLAWPPSIDRRGLESVPLLRQTSRTATSWLDGKTTKTEMTTHVSADFVFRPAPVPGNKNGPLHERVVRVEAGSALFESTPTGPSEEREIMTFRGQVRVHLPDGSSLSGEGATWDSAAGPLPKVTLRLQ